MLHYIMPTPEQMPDLDERPILGLLLLYSESYSNSALRQFETLLHRITPNYMMVVILNQPLDLPDFRSTRVRFIHGDNRLREFSGWDKGLRYCRESGLLSQCGMVIFANDTFCHHNKFGPISRFLFSSTFKKIMRRPESLALAGEVHSDCTTYSILGKKFSSWVSTYLFGMSHSLIQTLEQVSPDFQLDVFFGVRLSPEDFFQGSLNNALKVKLARWLFGHEGRSKWYGAELPTQENRAHLISKAKSIICEMYLSASVVQIPGQLISVFGSRWRRNLRRLEPTPRRKITHHNKN